MLTRTTSLCRSYAQLDQPLEARSDDVVLNARELLEDLGMHARALKGAALSARRLEQLEARMLDIEDDLEDLVSRAKKSDAYVCSVCDATFATAKELTVRCSIATYVSRFLRELFLLTVVFSSRTRTLRDTTRISPLPVVLADAARCIICR